MKQSWTKFIEDSNLVLHHFPALRLDNRENTCPFLEGKIPLRDADGEVYDVYSIEIECSEDYPDSFPSVFETDGRLPNNFDWHIYPDGHFCICTPLEEYITCSQRITLLGFIQNEVIPFLHNQSYREREGFFIHERSHGKNGMIEALLDVLNTNNVVHALSMLKFIYYNPPPLRTSKCFCGSGKKYRHCHKDSYLTIRKIGRQRIERLLYCLGSE